MAQGEGKGLIQESWFEVVWLPLGGQENHSPVMASSGRCGYESVSSRTC